MKKSVKEKNVVYIKSPATRRNPEYTSEDCVLFSKAECPYCKWEIRTEVDPVLGNKFVYTLNKYRCIHLKSVQFDPDNGEVTYEFHYVDFSQFSLPDDHIVIWPFEYAPDIFKSISDNGGDEDWVAFVPDRIYKNYDLLFLGVGSSFGPAYVVEVKVPSGYILIGCHA